MSVATETSGIQRLLLRNIIQSSSDSSSTTNDSADTTDNDSDHADWLSIDFKDQYRRHLTLHLKRGPQYEKIYLEASISALIIVLWSGFNFYYLFAEINDIFQFDIEDAPSPVELVIYFYAIYGIWLNLVSCNGMASLIILILFNASMRMVFELIVDFLCFPESICSTFNLFGFLIVLLIICSRFTFGIWSPSRHQDLIRCNLFYRGSCIRWMNYLIYCRFNSLFLLELMDSLAVCFGNIGDGREIIENPRLKFISCDSAIVLFGALVNITWDKAKHIDLEREEAMKYGLFVEGYGLTEVVVLFGVFLFAFAMWDVWLEKVLTIRSLFVITLLFAQIANYLMR